MIIKAKPSKINGKTDEVFAFLCDFNNFERLMPDQVTNWTSSSDSCTFTIQGMATLSLKYARQDANRYIEIVPDGKSPLAFSLMVKLEADAENPEQTVASVEIDADLNPMMAMMVKRPLQNLVEVIANNLNKVFGG